MVSVCVSLICVVCVTVVVVCGLLLFALIVLILAGLGWACQCFRFWLLVGFLVVIAVRLVLYGCLSFDAVWLLRLFVGCC